MSLDHKILQHIKRDAIPMKSSGFFYAQDISKVFVSLILSLISSVLCGIFIALTVHGLGEISLRNFPYILVVLCAITALLAYESFVHAFSFYRIRFSVGILIIAFSALSIGYILFVTKQAEKIERKLQSLPLYHHIVPQALWEHEQLEDMSDQHP